MSDAKDFKKYTFITRGGQSTMRSLFLLCVVCVIFSFAVEKAGIASLTISFAFFCVGFILANMLSGLVISELLRNFKKEWSMFIVLINVAFLIVIVLFSILSDRIDLLDSMILWAVFSFTIWLLSIMGLTGREVNLWSISASLFQPFAVWLMMFASFGLRINTVIEPLVLIGGMTAAIALSMKYMDHLSSLIVTETSGFVLLSDFLKGLHGETTSLNVGRKVRAYLQYLTIKQAGNVKFLIMPWLHAGPLRSVGGGNLATGCIRELNLTNPGSYMMHAPSDHEYNPSDDVIDSVVEEVTAADTKPLKASKLVRIEEAGKTVTGQRLNDIYLITLGAKDIDDYQLSIFWGMRQKHSDKKIIIADMHLNCPLEEIYDVEDQTEDAVMTEKLIDEVVKKLEKSRMEKAEIGTAVRFIDDYSVFSMAVKTGKQKVVYFIADTNGLNPGEREFLKTQGEKMGAEVITMSTDTHSPQVKMLLSRPDIPHPELAAVMTEALATEEAEVGYSEKWVENVRILGKTYYELVVLTKLLSRIIPVIILLFFVFFILFLWIN